MDNSQVPRGLLRKICGLNALAFVFACAWGGEPNHEPLNTDVAQQVRQLALLAARAVPNSQGLRMEVELGSLDPRLQLAPCQKIEAYLPTGARAWGKTRVGLRCTQGHVRWNVSLAVAVHVFGPAVVAARPMPAGTVLAQEMLAVAEVDLAAEGGGAFIRADLLLGRTLARPLQAGEALRSVALRQRQWFMAGETVQVQANGAGYVISAEAQALGPGIEGVPVRVRFDNGRVVSVRAIGERRVQLDL